MTAPMMQCRAPLLLVFAALGLAPENAFAFSLNRGVASSSGVLGTSDADAETATKVKPPAATTATAAAPAGLAAQAKGSAQQQPAIMRRASSPAKKPAAAAAAAAAVQQNASAAGGSLVAQPPPLLPTDDYQQGGAFNPFAFDKTDGLTDLAYYISLEACETNTLLPPSGGFIFQGVPDLGVCGCKDWSTSFADHVSSTSCQHEDDGTLEIVIRQGLGCAAPDPMVLMVPGPELEDLRQGQCVMVNFPDSTTAYVRYEQFALRNDNFCPCEARPAPTPPVFPTEPPTPPAFPTEPPTPPAFPTEPPPPTTESTTETTESTTEWTTMEPTTTEPRTTMRRTTSAFPPAKPTPEPPAPALPFEAGDGRTDLAYYPTLEMCNSGTTAGGGGGFWYPGVPDLSPCGCSGWNAPFHGGGSYSARQCEEVNGDLSIRFFSGSTCQAQLEAAVIRVESHRLTALSQGFCVRTEGEVFGASMEHFVRLEAFRLSGAGFCLCEAGTPPTPPTGGGEGAGDDEGEDGTSLSLPTVPPNDGGEGDGEGEGEEEEGTSSSTTWPTSTTGESDSESDLDDNTGDDNTGDDATGSGSSSSGRPVQFASSNGRGLGHQLGNGKASGQQNGIRGHARGHNRGFPLRRR